MSNTFLRPSGVCFYTDEAVNANNVAKALRKVASVLQSDDPYIRLHRYDDWWEHDGLHFHRKVIDFNELFSLVSSPKRLLESTPGDDFVFVGVAPDNCKWYLRYRVEWDEDEALLIGQCAVIISLDDIKIVRELEEIDWLKRTDSDSYYTETIL